MTWSKMSNIITAVSQEQEESEGGISYDTVFFTLSNPRRRFVLHHLKQCDGPVSVGELASKVAAWENQTTPDLVTNKQRKRAYSALHQTHLPKMNQLGVIAYDRDRGVIEPTAPVDALDFYLEIVPRNSAPWHEYYLGIAGASVAVLVVAWLQVVPGLTPAVASILLTLSILSMAVYHNYTARRRKLGESDMPPSVRFENMHYSDESEGQ